VDEQRRVNEHVRVDWLTEFGSDYATVRESEQRLRALERRRGLLRASPGLSREGVEALAAEIERGEQGELEKLRREVALCPALRPVPFDATGFADDEQIANYREKLMTALVKVKKSLYPDHLQRHPNYARLSEEQRRELADIHQRWRVRPSELRYSPDQLGYLMPALHRILSDLARAERILATAGMALDARAFVHGATLEEKVAWLDAENGLLKREIEEEQSRLLSLSHDATINAWREDLCVPVAWEEIHDELRREAKELERQSQAVAREIEAHWSRPASAAAGAGDDARA
jgi:hypothetical protein